MSHITRRNDVRTSYACAELQFYFHNNLPQSRLAVEQHLSLRLRVSLVSARESIEKRRVTDTLRIEDRTAVSNK